MSIDKDKLRYDLALVYAQTKFKQALEHEVDFGKMSVAPTHINECDYLIKQFNNAFQYLDAYPKELLAETVEEEAKRVQKEQNIK